MRVNLTAPELSIKRKVQTCRGFQIVRPVFRVQPIGAIRKHCEGGSSHNKDIPFKGKAAKGVDCDSGTFHLARASSKIMSDGLCRVISGGLQSF
nr:MAG TPA: hypothetical protein [Caudoviricetes sp.]